MRMFRNWVGLVVLLCSTSLMAELPGTYVLSFGELSTEQKKKEAVGSQLQEGTRLIDQWRDLAAKEKVTLEIRGTDVENQFDGTWRASTLGFETSKINLRGTEFGFVFHLRVDGESYIFDCNGEVVEGELQGTLWTVWGEVPMTGKRKIPQLAGTYLVTFGELTPGNQEIGDKGNRLLNQWRDLAASNEVLLELRATDVENEFDAIWEDTLTQPVKGYEPRKIYIRPHEVSLLFAREYDEVRYIFHYLCEIEESELRGTLQTPWGDVPMFAKLKIDEGTESPEDERVLDESDS